MNLEALKNLKIDRVFDIEEAIAMSSDVRMFEAECAELDLEVPAWLLKVADVLREEIARRTRAGDLAELQRLENEIDGYKTVGEKKNEAQRKLAAMQRKLGIGNRAAAGVKA